MVASGSPVWFVSWPLADYGCLGLIGAEDDLTPQCIKGAQPGMVIGNWGGYAMAQSKEGFLAMIIHDQNSGGAEIKSAYKMGHRGSDIVSCSPETCCLCWCSSLRFFRSSARSSIPNHQHLNPSTLGLNATIGPICEGSSMWALPTFSKADCDVALRRFHNTARVEGDLAFEFQIPGARSTTSLPKAKTPAAFQYGMERTDLRESYVLMSS